MAPDIKLVRTSLGADIRHQNMRCVIYGDNECTNASVSEICILQAAPERSVLALDCLSLRRRTHSYRNDRSISMLFPTSAKSFSMFTALPERFSPKMFVIRTSAAANIIP